MRKPKVVTLTAFLLFSGCASYSYTFSDNLPRGVDGQTTCKGNTPHVAIRKGLSAEWGAVVNAHEIVHVEQMHREKSCASFILKYQSSSSFRRNSEAEAFCRTMSPLSDDKRTLRNLVMALLLGSYSVGTPEDVARSVVTYCR